MKQMVNLKTGSFFHVIGTAHEYAVGFRIWPEVSKVAGFTDMKFRVRLEYHDGALEESSSVFASKVKERFPYFEVDGKGKGHASSVGSVTLNRPLSEPTELSEAIKHSSAGKMVEDAVDDVLRGIKYVDFPGYSTFDSWVAIEMLNAVSPPSPSKDDYVAELNFSGVCIGHSGGEQVMASFPSDHLQQPDEQEENHLLYVPEGYPEPVPEEDVEPETTEAALPVTTITLTSKIEDVGQPKLKKLLFGKGKKFIGTSHVASVKGAPVEIIGHGPKPPTILDEFPKSEAVWVSNPESPKAFVGKALLSGEKDVFHCVMKAVYGGLGETHCHALTGLTLTEAEDYIATNKPLVARAISKVKYKLVYDAHYANFVLRCAVNPKHLFNWPSGAGEITPAQMDMLGAFGSVILSIQFIDVFDWMFKDTSLAKFVKHVGVSKNDFKKVMALHDAGPSEFDAIYASWAHVLPGYLQEFSEEEKLGIARDALNGFPFNPAAANKPGKPINNPYKETSDENPLLLTFITMFMPVSDAKFSSVVGCSRVEAFERLEELGVADDFTHYMTALLPLNDKHPDVMVRRWTKMSKEERLTTLQEFLDPY